MIGSTMKKLFEFKIKVTEIANHLESDGFLKGVHDLHRSDRDFLRKVLKKKLNKSEWPTALFRLTRLLHILNKRKVVLLVDEYDTPTSYTVRNGYFS